MLRFSTGYKYASILFSATTLEALINFYAVDHNILHKSDFEKNLSSLNKWRLYPKIVKGIYINEHILDQVRKIFNLRDRIVHPKTKSIKLEQEERFFTPSEGMQALNWVQNAIQALNIIDEGKIGTDWINDTFNGAVDFDVSSIFIY